MPISLSFDFYGDVQIDRTLERFSDAVEDARPAWEAIADRFAHVERRQFGTEGRHASGGWAPLSPRYAAWKARHYPGRPILVREGDLRASLTQRPFGVERIEPHDAWLGSDVAHGRYHQRGQGVPRRRPIELTEQERRTWVKILQRFIVTGEAPTVGPRGGFRTSSGGRISRTDLSR
jgi:phage gpG-like protein